MTTIIIKGDCRETLKLLDADSVDCVVTSPPYWGLRSYLPNDHPHKRLEIGLEPTLGEHIETLCDVFEEVRRVMKPRAALWLNYGDCYATTPNGRSAADTKAAGKDDRTFRDKPFSTVQGLLKPKDLCLLPFRLAIALQERGWWVRSRCIWGKPNGMPDSSGRWRPSVAHEEIFLLSKSGDLDYDFEAVKKPCEDGNWKRPDNWDTGEGGHGKFHREGRENGSAPNRLHGDPDNHGSTLTGRWDGMTKEEQQENGRLLRTYEPEVWHMATSAYSEAHFATFPPALVERCLMASCGPGLTVLDPFGGAGTVGMVADRMGRNAILCELGEDYVEMAARRIKRDGGMFAEVSQA